jgi:hypothetical protein
MLQLDSIYAYGLLRNAVQLFGRALNVNFSKRGAGEVPLSAEEQELFDKAVCVSMPDSNLGHGRAWAGPSTSLKSSHSTPGSAHMKRSASAGSPMIRIPGLDPQSTPVNMGFVKDSAHVMHPSQSAPALPQVVAHANAAGPAPVGILPGNAASAAAGTPAVQASAVWAGRAAQQQAVIPPPSQQGSQQHGVDSQQLAQILIQQASQAQQHQVAQLQQHLPPPQQQQQQQYPYQQQAMQSGTPSQPPLQQQAPMQGPYNPGVQPGLQQQQQAANQPMYAVPYHTHTSPAAPQQQQAPHSAGSTWQQAPAAGVPDWRTAARFAG